MTIPYQGIDFNEWITICREPHDIGKLTLTGFERRGSNEVMLLNSCVIPSFPLFLLLLLYYFNCVIHGRLHGL